MLLNLKLNQYKKRFPDNSCYIQYAFLLHRKDAIENICNMKNLSIQFGLNKSLDINLSSLSFGQQKKIALLRVFLNDSDLLVLDEPCVGLDQQSQEYLCTFINNELTLGKSILFSSHISLDINSEALNLKLVKGPLKEIDSGNCLPIFIFIVIFNHQII